jgi:hypothetical protein
MTHTRNIASFAGKMTVKGRKTNFKVPQPMKSENGNYYVALVFDAVIDATGHLLPSTIRFYYASRKLLMTIVPGMTYDVEPIEKD